MIKKSFCLCALLACLLGTSFLQAAGESSVLPLPAGFGDRGPHVRLLQTELARRGFFQGEPDGIYGKLTVKAVEQFQKQRELPLDGLAGDTALPALFARSAFNSADFDAANQTLPRQAGFQAYKGIPLPSSQGARGSHVRRLQQALAGLGYLPTGAAGVFSETTAQAVASFQKDSGLRVSGRADEASLRVLFTKPKSVTGATLMPPWYGGGSGLIPRGAVFQVKDVRTGIKFTCSRMMGTSHLDAEPLTPFDTLAMKEAYGGDWSWDRRPVLLNYRGEVYAASMNGMPHGYYSNRGNTMKGHFCIHFFGSRGDTSQLVDSAHLQAAFEASLTQWDSPATGEPVR